MVAGLRNLTKAAAVWPFSTGMRMHCALIFGSDALTISPFSMCPKTFSGSISLFSSSPPIYGITFPTISGQSLKFLPAPLIAWYVVTIIS